jgi:8-oxo-dGTP pyrophosphatase MutT (NUDIX family)
MGLLVVEKVFAYITWEGRLLVFDHVAFPEAGTQVPAGTIIAGEPPVAAALREAREETGLAELSSPVYLGTTEFDARPCKDETHRRHFFQLPLLGSAPERWRHFEPHASESGEEAIAFELYWVSLPVAAAQLAHGHGALLGVLKVALPDPPGRRPRP